MVALWISKFHSQNEFQPQLFVVIHPYVMNWSYICICVYIYVCFLISTNERHRVIQMETLIISYWYSSQKQINVTLINVCSTIWAKWLFQGDFFQILTSLQTPEHLSASLLHFKADIPNHCGTVPGHRWLSDF